MTALDIMRAWKDEEYRLSLTEAQRAELPAHPAGLIEREDAELEVAAGGAGNATEVGCTGMTHCDMLL